MRKRTSDHSASESLTPPKRSRRLLEIRTHTEPSLSPLSCKCNGFSPSTPRRASARVYPEVTTPPKVDKRLYRSTAILAAGYQSRRVSPLPF